MKITPLIFITFLVFSACKSQSNEIVELHPMVKKVKTISLYSDAIDWKSVNAKFIELTENKTTTEALKPGLQFLINSLGDKHAAIRSAKDYSIIVSYTGKIEEADNRKSAFVNTVINDISAKFSYQLLPNNIGYLKVVGIGGGDVKAQADLIRSGLVNLKTKNVNKWILDLRYNGGGNMEPMISGLAPLVGEGFIGGASNYEEITRTYEIKDGQFYNYNRLACEMDNLPRIDTTEKVAVLLSRYTISSGEVVAIAFKGRQNTKFFGEPTAGYTTGNSYEKLNDELLLMISQDIYMDRNKVLYDERVGVDKAVEFEHQLSLENDNQVEAAMKWLKK